MRPPIPLLSSMMLLGCGSSGGGGIPAPSAELEQYLARLFTPLTSGGSLEGHYADFIDGLESDGVWDLMDQITLTFGGNTEGDTLVNLKNGTWSALRASVAGHAVWTQGEYYDQGGTLKCISSNFNPSTAVGANFSRNNLGIGVWISDATQYNGPAFSAGVWDAEYGFTDPSIISLAPKLNDGQTLWNANGSYLYSTGMPDSSGFFWVQRTGANAAALYRNNVLIATDTSSSVALPNAELYVTCKHRTRAFVFGASLTEPQRTALWTRLGTFVTAITGGIP